MVFIRALVLDLDLEYFPATPLFLAHHTDWSCGYYWKNKKKCLHFQQALLCNILIIVPIRLLITTTMLCKSRQHLNCMSRSLAVLLRVNGINFSFLFSLIFCPVLRFLFLPLYQSIILCKPCPLPPPSPAPPPPPLPLLPAPPIVSSENNFVRVDLEQFVIRSHLRLLSARKVNNYLKNKPENLLIISMLYFDCQILQ